MMKMDDLFPHTLGAPAQPLKRLESASPRRASPRALDADIVYCTTIDAAARLLEEMRQDAAGWPLGLDIETTPLPEHAARLRRCSCARRASRASSRRRGAPRRPLPRSRP